MADNRKVVQRRTFASNGTGLLLDIIIALKTTKAPVSIVTSHFAQSLINFSASNVFDADGSMCWWLLSGLCLFCTPHSNCKMINEPLLCRPRLPLFVPLLFLSRLA